MWEKIKNTLVVALATLGVLFIVIMLIPDDEESYDEADTAVTQEEADSVEAEEETSESGEPEVFYEDTEPEESVKEEAEEEETADAKEDDEKGNAVTVSIPSSELSDRKLSFRTVSLDNKEVSDDIFSDYDITVVHVWGTFCQPCIAEMGDYASLYSKLPDNVNLVAIICDVYDGIDSNVADANDILGDAGAKFLNLRTSDDLYDVVGQFQYVPSSFFVDKNGHLIGEMMDGAGFDETMERLQGYIEWER